MTEPEAQEKEGSELGWAIMLKYMQEADSVGTIEFEGKKYFYEQMKGCCGQELRHFHHTEITELVQ